MEETKCLLSKLVVCKAESLSMELGRENTKAKRLIDGLAGNELTFQQNTFKVFPSSRKRISKLQGTKQRCM